MTLIPTLIDEEKNTLVQAQHGPAGETSPFRIFVDEYFYYSMALLFIAIKLFTVVHSSAVPASYVEGDTPIHPAASRPLILWVHNIVFSGWLVFFLCQSALVHAHRVKWHRFLGWFGVGLGLVMVPIGIAVAMDKCREELTALFGLGAVENLLIRSSDVIAFGVLLALAILCRKHSAFHRRFIFIATCVLLNSSFMRFTSVQDHSLSFVLVDLLIVLGVLRDLMVERRVHKVYLIALPALMAVQAFVTYAWQYDSAWWLRTAQTIIG